ncbi:MAG: hypothetical protein JSR37_05565 [Verrucomicrobia bacterium]|nr:hypothetical protein [Verrucomicrobiota bacterium]MBS0637870.1 hypothetical protein [Verrucomicrobiota bacterium]
MTTISSLFRLADPSDLVARAEYTLQHQPEKLCVEQYSPPGRKFLLSDDYSWITEAGQITGIVARYFSYVMPFWQTVEIRLDSEDQLLDDFEPEEAVALAPQKPQVVSPFSFTSENGTFFFYEGGRKIRSPGMSEEALVASLCGTPQPDLGIVQMHHLNTIRVDGTPDLLIGLKQKGEKCFLNSNFISRAISRLVGFDDRPQLVAFGRVRAAGELEEKTKFQVPPKRLITAKRVDTAFFGLLAVGTFTAFAATYHSSPWGRNVIGGFVLAAALKQAYSSYYSK